MSAFPDDTKLKRTVVELLGPPAAGATPAAEDIQEPPERVETTTYRILRDTELARRIKRKHKFCCQICGEFIEMASKKRYAEAHHIKPLGRDHKGPDIAGNVICLCPNHHAECDLGVRRLSLKTLRQVEGHTVEKAFIDYHNKHIYGSR